MMVHGAVVVWSTGSPGLRLGLCVQERRSQLLSPNSAWNALVRAEAAATAAADVGRRSAGGIGPRAQSFGLKDLTPSAQV